MKISISKDYTAYSDSDLLGYKGETNTRIIEVAQPVVEGADTYRLRFEYSNAVYDVPIVDGKVKITASLLCEVGQIKCQWIATKADGDNYLLVAKSNVFALSIGNSISDDVAPIPSYELSKSTADKVLEAENNALGYARQAEQYKYQAMSFKDIAKEQAGAAKANALIAEANRERAENSANIAVQKADELTALLDGLNSTLEICLNGGAVDG